MSKSESDAYQEQIRADKFYMQNGECCSGCDHWRGIGGTIGECTNSKIISSKDRLVFLGLRNCTLDIGAGHAITRRDYVCGQFKDEFDWQSLPLSYLKKIGHKNHER